MRFKELAAILSEHTYVYLVDETGYLLGVYDGRDSIDPKYGEYGVLEVSISNTLIPNKFITVAVKEA